jgi:acetoin utilization deacetylase AcuC-like enzyme
MPGNHPEAPARLDAIEQALEAAGSGTLREQSVPADFAQLRRVHATDYLQALQNSSPITGYHALAPDTFMNPHTFEAALLAAGAGVLGVDRIMQGRAASAFCAVRPPGHHARRAQAMGFCLINNIAVAAMHALTHHNLRRVAILDFDVHHGNGTQDIVINERGVLFCSTHQHPFYPYTGEPAAAPHIINVPLPAGSGSEEFRRAVLREWLPALEQFKPDFIFVSAGFDAHRDDPLGGLSLVEADYGWIGAQIRDFAAAHCGGRVLSMLEGGYNVTALARSVAAYIRSFEN